MTTQRTPAAERDLNAALQVFDLGETAGQLRAEGPRSAKRNTITLRNAPGLRVVLLAMQAGDQLHDHRAPGPITLHVVSGRVRFATENESVELGPQMVAALDGNITHRVEAIEEALCVLTLGSPPTTETVH